MKLVAQIKTFNLRPSTIFLVHQFLTYRCLNAKKVKIIEKSRITTFLLFELQNPYIAHFKALVETNSMVVSRVLQVNQGPSYDPWIFGPPPHFWHVNLKYMNKLKSRLFNTQTQLNAEILVCVMGCLWLCCINFSANDELQKYWFSVCKKWEKNRFFP